MYLYLSVDYIHNAVLKLEVDTEIGFNKTTAIEYARALSSMIYFAEIA